MNCSFQFLIFLFFKSLGIFAIGLATFVVSTVVVGYYKSYYPFLLTKSFPFLVSHLIIFSWLIGGVVYSYYKVIRTKPGGVPLGMKTREQIDQIKQGRSKKYRYCKKCDNIKPPRCHHDRVTGKCVLKMDHYCVWINDCVGHYNHKFFLQFLTYCCLGCLYIVLCTFTPFLVDIGFLKPSSTSNQNYEKCSILFVICLVCLISVSFLLFWHMFLALTNQTTIEYYENKDRKAYCNENGLIYKNEYDLGKRNNWNWFFELKENDRWWKFLFNFRRISNDGITYPKANSTKKSENIL
ncbi:palmitoyltransferase zdhhc16 [Anaeramoeba flamelloides]|uniref:Palmitoyltransferase n=1 Tax=Anaeramoeba flamelloides TaxID=1746091 RepID=A0ABQ8YFD8_9EUKA|nr:palmitoyltransferase zdhhc16 [Anaeramoeba flamelloides]